MREMEERGVGEEESDVILVSEGIVYERERERVCFHTQSIDSFFTEFEKIKPSFEII